MIRVYYIYTYLYLCRFIYNNKYEDNNSFLKIKILNLKEPNFSLKLNIYKDIIAI